MNWRHYEVRGKGFCLLTGDNGKFEAAYELGIVSTGRSRVFSGYFVRIDLGKDQGCSGEDESSLRAALKRLAHNLSPRNLALICAGIYADWTESGLSWNTGTGYWGPEKTRVRMMDPAPLETSDDASEWLDRLIREAVGGMKIGIAGKT